MSTARRIAHIDMDAFFASCELSRYPELRGLPMVVAGRQTHAPKLREDGAREFARLKDYVGRGVLTTATYEARALGVHSGMPTMKAARLAPEAILLPVNFDLYRQYSRQFKDAIRAISPIIQDVGIDEIYSDISALEASSEEIADVFRASVFDKTQLTCSVGIAPNKLLAKLCSDIQKPNGFTIITMADIPNRIWPMSVRKINGIGPKSAEKLDSLNIQTIGQLAACREEWLLENFGRSYGAWLHRVAHGLDDRPVVTETEPVSMSRETTFERDLHPSRDKNELGRFFTRLCEQVAADLQRKGYVCKKIGVKLRFKDFSTVTRDTTLKAATADALEIRRAAGNCLKRIVLDQSIRLLGVKTSGLLKLGSSSLEEPIQFLLDI
ncbi:DNA polymerase IV [Herbaspirillum sp. C7C8]|uniref:DNA polymerase IV n=1 Tax=Herbaspirillum sp. C7C8 TaxID=2736665 RepID=UPI001F5247D2|nr:DNA polymerase IV [Herbaspirillum sp. C7C8]MCI1004281.1 DNA polymerase IV [Herbaspirillum sp. C7C8]